MHVEILNEDFELRINTHSLSALYDYRCSCLTRHTDISNLMLEAS